MRKLKIFIILVGVFTSLYFLVGWMLPSKWSVQRAVLIRAPKNKIYPYIASLKNGWVQWSAFDSEDPDILYIYEGPEEGAGASRTWTSETMGNGHQIITKATADRGVEFELRMQDSGFTIKGKLTMKTKGSATEVSWIDYGDSGDKISHKYISSAMDLMMGSTFEKSLLKLKELCELGLNLPPIPITESASQTVYEPESEPETTLEPMTEPTSESPTPDAIQDVPAEEP